MVTKIIIPHQANTYSSFPNFTDHDGRIFIFYRQSLKDDTHCHGVNGKIKCFEIEKDQFTKGLDNDRTESLYELGTEFIVFENKDENMDENEALVSKLDKYLFSLATRTYDFKKRKMKTFLSISDRPVFKERHEVKVKGVKWFIFYGKAFKWENGYIFPAYGEMKGAYSECPLVLFTRDFLNFELLSFLLSDINGPILNESSIIFDGKKYVIFMRDDVPPFGIWYSVSDDLKTWEPPELLFFAAHAPKACFFNNEILLSYRDLISKTKTGVSLLSLPSYKKTLIDVFEGSPYDGGYTDMNVMDGKMHIVYYAGNPEGEPFIKCCRL